MRRRSFIKGSAATLAAMGAVGQAPAVFGQAAGNRVLTMVPHANLTSVDPIWTTAYISRNHGYMVYDTLFGTDSNFQVRPQMASGHEVSSDGKTYTIRLRDGLKFHDGQPVLAKDAVASLNRWAKRDSFGQFAWTLLDQISATDDKTISVRLKQAFPGLLTAIAKPSSNVPFIMPERVAATDAFQQIRPDDVIGSGPFKFVRAEYRPGDRMTWEKNTDYVPRSEPASWSAGGKVVNVDRVVWRILPDSQTAAAALQSGEVDWYEQPAPDLLGVLRRARNIKVEILDNLGNMAMMRFNHLHPPFNNPAIRRAVQMAVNQADYLSAMMGNDAELGRECLSMFTCGTPLASDTANDIMKIRSVERARAALREAGYNNERVVVISPTDIPISNAASQVTNDLLRRIGMNVEYRATDWGTVVQTRASREPGAWNIFHTWWVGADMANPAVSSGLRGNGAGAWFGWSEDPQIEELRNQWMVAPNDQESRRLAGEIQKRALEQMPFVTVGHFFLPSAYRTNLTGVLPGPVPWFWGVSKA
jgi:peptide/nickel transport system substrate-binding protein